MEKNKYKLIKEIFAASGDSSNDDLLNCMMAFDNLFEKGFIEKFTNEYNEIDYRITGRTGTLEILQNKAHAGDFVINKTDDELNE